MPFILISAGSSVPSAAWLMTVFESNVAVAADERLAVLEPCTLLGEVGEDTGTRLLARVGVMGLYILR